ncbi:MAG: hypothetical protein DMG24_06570, partial [Acidobacteria bacterium]
MNARLLFGCFLLAALQLVGAEAPRAGEEVDLAAFGQARTWDGNPGVEWDEPRVVRRVEVDFSGAGNVPAEGALSVEYWVSNWPPLPRGGWTKTDTPWQGEWRKIMARREVNGERAIFRFQPLSELENPNTKNVPGFSPSFRKTLKLRLRFSGAPSFLRLRAYGSSWWREREVNIQSGCEGKEWVPISVTAYNGIILGSHPLEANPQGLRFNILYTDHDPGSDDRTIMTIHGAKYEFGVSLDDVFERKGVYVKPFGIFIGDASAGMDFASFLESGAMRPEEDIIGLTSRQPEQSLTKAMGEVPRLSMMGRASRHPLRYIPLGFPASREKYGLDFNGNVFISKGSSKAMKEDLARMLWDGDEIYFRIGTGAAPDFRERPTGTRQELLNDVLPFVTTRWENEGIDYTEEAYATMLDAPLDDARLRGDEPSVLQLRLRVHNPGSKPVRAQIWLQASTAERLELKNTLLLGTSNKSGVYPQPRLRAVLEPEGGTVQIRDLPPSAQLPARPEDGNRQPAPSAYGGAAVWTALVPAHGTKILGVKIPFRTMTSPVEMKQVSRIRFETRLDETLGYWKRRITSGMRLHVPDEMLNSFYLAVLQHILVSEERDLKTGYMMCPCGTYDYNMFANETDIQVRLLDMRGLREDAWRCLRPIVELQGSKPFPGRFRETSAEFHGVKVDNEHDYTHGGYNLNHGWTLWTLAEHYLFTRDDQWLRGVMPSMIKAANWIVDERKATMQQEPEGTRAPEYGLLPAGELEDNEDWEYWFAVNGYAYRGLNAAAEAASAIDPAEGGRLTKEAMAYRADIRKAAFGAMAIAPVVPLRDGTFAPHIPPRTSLHGRDLGWIRNVLYGAHGLVDCGVFDAQEPAATWILEDYEDNLFMAPDSLSVP